MSTYTNADVVREYFTIGYVGKHVGPITLADFADEYAGYVRSGGQVLAGFGKHRASRYPNSRYNVVEDGTRDALKAAMLGKRSDYALRA